MKPSAAEGIKVGMATGRVWGGFGHYQTRPAYIFPRPEPETGFFLKTQTRPAKYT
ncbi:hypothetical protein LguiA_013399 [Lonicera macranthoides]